MVTLISGEQNLKKKTILFIFPQKRKKEIIYLNVNLTKHAQGLHDETTQLK